MNAGRTYKPIRWSCREGWRARLWPLGVLAMVLGLVNVAYAEPNDRWNTTNAEGGAFQQSTSASGFKPAGNTQPKDNGEPTLVEQAKLYERANENVALQVIYIENNLDALLVRLRTLNDFKDKKGKKLITDIEDDSKDGVKGFADYVKRETSQFCDNPVEIEQTIDCINQFRDIRIGQLRELKESLSSNHDALASLKSELKANKGGSARAPTFASKGKSGNLPKIPSFIDLDQEYKKSPGEDKSSKRREQIQAFLKRTLRAPDPKDFVKYEEVPADPSKPKGALNLVILRNEKGEPVLDPKAYQQALGEYQAMLADVRKRQRFGEKNGNPEALLKNIENDILDKSKPGKSKDSLSKLVGGDDKLKLCKDLPSGPRYDYCLARQLVIMHFNDEVPGQTGQGQPNQLAAPTRGLANKKAPTYDQYSEEYSLKPPKESDKDKETTDSLYMSPSYIDDVIKGQFNP